MKIAGVVLAAGASTRMGTSKALLRAGDQTFLDALATVLAVGGCEPVLAVVSEPADGIRSRCRLEGVRLVINPDPARGQISSLRCAIREIDAAVSGMVVLLVDQGAVKASTVAQVREALSVHPVAVARHAGRPGHPTGFSRQAFGDLDSALADCGARAVVQAWEEAGRVEWVDVDDPGVVRNINTQERYLAFLAEYGFNR
jgi:molybdenum cofactor cytidylyltransferase